MSSAPNDVVHLDHPEAVDHPPARDAALAGERATARDDGDLEAQPGRLGDPLGQVADPAQLAGEADLPDGDGTARRRHAEVGAGDRDGDGEVGGRVVELGPADGRDERVAAGDAQPGVAREDGEHHVDAGRLDARRPYGAGARAGEGVSSACTSASSGRRPSIVTATQVPETSWVWCSTKSPVGSVTAEMPSDDRSKQPTSSTGP